MRLLLAHVLVALLAAVTSAAAQDDFGLLGGGITDASAPKATVEAVANFDAVQPGQQVVIAVVLDVREGYHAQSATPLVDNLIAFDIATEPSETYVAYEPDYAEGVLKNYPLISPDTGGDVSLYVGETVHFVPVVLAADLEPGETVTISGTATYQACDDQTCDPPVDAAWSVELPVAAESIPNEAAAFATFDPTIWTRLQEATGGGETAFELFGYELDLADTGVLGTLALAFVAGVIFNVVPCVLPVLPLKAISFYEVSQHRRGRTLLLGVAFGLGVVLVFLTLGVLLFAVKAFTWGEPFSNPWFSGAIALVLAVMAFYQFGFLTFSVPMKLYSVTPRHDTLSGNVLFGGLTALLSTPCTFGLFAALLSWALAQETWLAVTAVTIVGVGMASPYVLLSAFPEAARSFPRSGPLSDVVKKATGLLVLAIALFFAKVAIGPYLPAAIRGNAYWWVVFAPVAIACVYVTVEAARKARPVGAMITGLVAASLLVGGGLVTLRLANDPFEPFTPERLAARDDSPTVVKFTADWCLNCKTIEASVFGDGDFVGKLRSDGVTLLKADLTSDDAEGWPLLAELNPARAIPFTAVYLPGEDRPRKLTGIYDKADLREALQN